MVSSRTTLFLALVALAFVAHGVEALTQAQPTCRPGAYVIANTAGVTCPPGKTASAPLSGVGSCCSCPLGTSGPKCDRCAPAVSGTTPSGVDEAANAAGGCKCLAGYANYNPATKTCTRCPVNTASPDGSACRACAALNSVSDVTQNNWYAAPGSKTCTQINCPSNAAVTNFMPDGGYDVSHCRPCDFASTNGLVYPSVCKCRAGWGNFAVVTNPTNGDVRGFCTQQCLGDTVSYSAWPVGTQSGFKIQRCAQCKEVVPTAANYVPNPTRDGCVAPGTKPGDNRQ